MSISNISVNVKYISYQQSSDIKILIKLVIIQVIKIAAVSFCVTMRGKNVIVR